MLPKPQIFEKLQKLLPSLELYLVGGAVRDLLLGLEPTDYDFATPQDPDTVEEAIRSSGRKPYSVGKRFGTIGLKLPMPDGTFEYVEITTFRKEVYGEGRKPRVNYITNIQQDLSRRDFTINAIAMDDQGYLIDPAGGQRDIAAKTIKTVGNPNIRYKEDPLRMLRAVRFSGRYGFDIEAETLKSIRKRKFSLLAISKERWMIELDKILSFENPTHAMNMLMDTGLMGIMIPELVVQKGYDQNSPYHDFTLWEHTLRVVHNVPAQNVDMRWAALLHDVAKPFTRTENPKGHSNYIGHEVIGAECVYKIGRYLKWSNERRENVSVLVRGHLQEGSELKGYDDAGKKMTFQS